MIFLADNCNSLFTPDGLNIIREVLSWFRIIAPILLILLTAIDLATAVVNQEKSNSNSEAFGKIVRRAIAVLLLFFVPTIIKIIFELDGVKGMFADDPLCENATGTEYKYDIYVSQKYDKKTNLTNVYEECDNCSKVKKTGQTITEKNKETTSRGVIYGPGNSAKRSYKTVTINGRTYDMYKQPQLGDIAFDGCDLKRCGCSAIAFASAVSGFNDSITIYDAAKMVKARTFTGIQNALSQVGIPTSGPYYYNSNDHDSAKVASLAARIREHFAKGKPVIALITGDNKGVRKYCTNNHFITLLGEDEQGNLIISNAGVELGNLEELIDQYMPGGRKGVILVG